MISDKQLMEELAVQEVLQETSSDLVAKNLNNSMVIKGVKLVAIDDLDDYSEAELRNFLELYVCEGELSDQEIFDLLDFYDVNTECYHEEDLEDALYEHLVDSLTERAESLMSEENFTNEEVDEEVDNDFESFSENFDEEYAELEARIQRASSAPTESKALGLDLTELMVLGLI